MKWRVGLLCLGLGLFVAISCNWGMNQGDRKLRLENDRGEPVVILQSYDSLLVALQGVEPKTHFDFTVTRGGTVEPILGQAHLTSDRHGIIPRTPLLIDIDPNAIVPDTYDVRVTGPDLDETVTVDVRFASEPHVFTCDFQGAMANSYSLGDPVYVTGGGFPPGALVHVGVHIERATFADGDALDTYFQFNHSDPRAPTTVRADAQGRLPVIELDPYHAFNMTQGTGFDVVADLPPFGVFNAHEDAADGHQLVGGTYQDPDVGSDADCDIACDRQRVYQETFQGSGDVYAYVNPPGSYTNPYSYADKYVLDHRHEWKNGDLLQDVSGGYETGPLQTGCTNVPPVLLFPGPLPPGEYDVIIDLDQDGRYTQGVDIVDGGSAESLGKVGFTVQ